MVEQAGASGGLGGVGAREMVEELNERINILMAENTVMADQVPYCSCVHKHSSIGPLIRNIQTVDLGSHQADYLIIQHGIQLLCVSQTAMFLKTAFPSLRCGNPSVFTTNRLQGTCARHTERIRLY